MLNVNSECVPFYYKVRYCVCMCVCVQSIDLVQYMSSSLSLSLHVSYLFNIIMRIIVSRHSFHSRTLPLKQKYFCIYLIKFFFKFLFSFLFCLSFFFCLLFFWVLLYFMLAHESHAYRCSPTLTVRSCAEFFWYNHKRKYAFILFSVYLFFIFYYNHHIFICIYDACIQQEFSLPLFH